MLKSQAGHPSKVAAMACLVVFSASSVNAWGPPGGFGSYPGSGSSSGSSGSSSGFPGISGSNGGGFPGSGILGFDIQTAMNYRTIHGILAAVAFVVLFPMGSMFMRLIPGRFAIWMHGFTQLIAYAVFIAAAALGFYLVQMVRIPFNGGNLLTNNATKHHPILGIVVLATLLVQPLLGLIHHAKFKRLQRRTVWSHLHIWNGRFGITVGIINGGLGLQLAGASNTIKLAYTIVAAIMWFLWMVTAVFGEIRRMRAPKRTVRQTRAPKRSSSRDAGSGE